MTETLHKWRWIGCTGTSCMEVPGGVIYRCDVGIGNAPAMVFVRMGKEGVAKVVEAIEEGERLSR